MKQRRRIVIATGNAGKLAEIRAALADVAVDWLSLADYPNVSAVEETGDTFEGNARIKAVHYSELTGEWSLADDSGLEVDGLAGAPGVRSARYAGEDATDASNNAKLIAALRGVSGERRTARFRCAMVLAAGREVLAASDGSIEGVIVDEARGERGFGYDPHFFVPTMGATLAELPRERKNAISHRGRAAAGIRPAILGLVERA
ncbi:MAG: RdgB/HAM1 family non-canonical purine NTP pyrophosphatase [Phycisphaerales bacterium]|nr:RdgB/HAM1 family non-canonical purine NTP pyrophosphatase [Phycisphaerales bacterium]